MNLSRKLTRLEVAACAGETCLICEATTVWNTAFDLCLAWSGAKAMKPRAEDIAVLECFECGYRREFDLSGIDAPPRRRYLFIYNEACSILRARLSREEQSKYQNLCREMCALTASSATPDTPETKQATFAAEQALLAWCEAHKPQIKEMMRRPALIKRRGFAA